MAFYIQDDYWTSAKKLPERERGMFLNAICAYAIDGVEPSFGDDDWAVAALFEAFRERIDLSKKRTEAGKSGANAKQTGSKTVANAKQTSSKTEANAEQTGSKPEAKPTEKEKENEKEIENENMGGYPLYIPPAPTESEVKAYATSFGHPDFDAAMFVAHYDGIGWRVRGQPIMDWQGVCRRWMLEDVRKGRKDDAGWVDGSYVIPEWDELAS